MEIYSLTLRSLLDTIIRLALIFAMKHLCKITISSNINCLKAILKNNQTFGRGDQFSLKSLSKKCLEGMGMFVLCLHLTTIFVTIQHIAFLLRHETQCFKLTL